MKNFARRFSKIFPSRISRLRSPRHGYIAIMLCFFIPIIILGTRWVLDNATLQIHKLSYFKNAVPQKKCAAQAALAVAQNWNPGLTLGEQKWALLKIADAIYNSSSSQVSSGLMYQAIPGLEMPMQFEVSHRGIFDPLRVKYSGYALPQKTIAYTTVTTHSECGKVRLSTCLSGCADAFSAIETTYSAIYSAPKSPYFVQEDTISDCIIHEDGGKNYIYYTVRYPNRTNLLNYVAANSETTVAGGTLEKRVNENDGSLTISVVKDKIKVTTDNDVGYAVPAQCNVDIVLGIPVNGAACNENNNDNYSTTSGSPFYETAAVASPSASAQSTPIYQIAQAFRQFIKDNFYYTRDAHVGLVPYSGNLSIPSDKINIWAKPHASFESSNFSADQNKYSAFFRACYTYGIGNLESLESEASSNDSIHIGLGDSNHSGLNIMRRLGKFYKNESTGQNYVYEGDLLSNDDPATLDSEDYSHKFGYPSLRRVPYRNSISYLNFKFQYYWNFSVDDLGENLFLSHNPYHIVELQADLTKITDLLQCFYPIKYNGNSQSNFIFLPITWAHNFFKNWTNDPQCDATDTSPSSTSTDASSGKLSRESKTVSNRKKAVILVVNKPDWFEPNELTYLGFDSDFAEIPMFDSDCIRFDIQQTASQKYADGTAKSAVTKPNSLASALYGQKKVLSYYSSKNADKFFWDSTDNCYQCSDNMTTVTGRLDFSQKYLIKIVVEPSRNTADDVVWTNRGKKFNKVVGWGTIGNNGETFLAQDTNDGKIYSSTDGINWEYKSTAPFRTTGNITYGNDGRWVLGGYSDSGMSGNIGVSEDNGETWSKYTTSFLGFKSIHNVMFGNERFVGLATQYSRAYSSSDGTSWELASDFSSLQSDSWMRALGYHDGKFIAIVWAGYVIQSTDNGYTWTFLNNGTGSPRSVTSLSQEFYGIIYAKGRYWAIGKTYVINSIDGAQWKVVGNTTSLLGSSSWARSIGYNGKVLVIVNDSGYVLTGNWGGTIKFTNLNNASGNFCTLNNTTYTIDARQEFFIEPEQLSDINCTFEMQNIRIISAEITNRPYEKVQVDCSLDGVTDGSGLAYVKTNTKSPMILRVKPKKPTGKITFYGDNKIEDNLGLQTIPVGGSKTFNFSGGTAPSGVYNSVNSSRGRNFGHNLSKYKIRYSCEHAYVSAATLTNQYIRDYINCYNRGKKGYKALILADGNLGRAGNDGTYSLSVNFGLTFGDTNNGKKLSTIPNVREYLAKFRDECMVLGLEDYSMYSQPNYGDYIISSGGPSFYWDIEGISGNLTIYNLYSPPSAATWRSSNASYEASTSYRLTFNGTATSFDQAYLKNGIAKTLKSTEIYTTPQDESGHLNSHITLERLASDISTQIVAGDYICFQGDGDLSVTVTTSDEIVPGRISHLNASNSTENITVNGEQSITINPKEFRYEKSDDGGYQISLNLDGITLDGLSFADNEEEYTIKFTVPRAPEYTRTVRYVGAEKKEVYLPNYHSWGSYYDAKKSHCYDSSAVSDFKLEGHFGEFFLLTDDDEHLMDQGTDNIYSYASAVGDFCDYLGSGLHRHFRPYATRNETADCFQWGVSGASSEKLLPVAMMGITLPINATLFYGASGTTSHVYGWQSNSEGEWRENDTTNAVRLVTVSALKKLYGEYKANLRIYVILYRKQQGYNYSYLTDLAANCGDNTDGATSENKPIFKCLDNVDDPNALKNALSKIAQEIQNWAGYKKAENTTAN